MTRSHDTPPAADLGPVWELLDELPRSSATPALARSTVAMATVDSPRRTTAGGHFSTWPILAAIAAAAFVSGFAWGSRTAPDPDEAILRGLPLIRHIELLRECGSVPFLEEVAKKQYPPPLRPGLRRGPEAVEEDAAAFTAALEALGKDVASGLGDTVDIAARRAAVLALEPDDRVELERGVERYRRMTAAERQSLTALAQALADPGRRQLREAALMWHRWLEVARPEDRAEVLAGGTSSRIDWLEWYATRGEGRRGPPPPGADGRGPDGRPPRPGPQRGPRGEGPRGGGPRPSVGP